MPQMRREENCENVKEPPLRAVHAARAAEKTRTGKMFMPKLLVVTSCTGEKKTQPENRLIQTDFADKKILSRRERELAAFRCAAGEMYTGMQHLRLMEGIQALRKRFGEDFVDLYIVSAGYGLISENELIAPYEVTFNTMSPAAISEWSRRIGIHKDLDALIPRYDLVLFLLGDKYLRAIELPFERATAEQKLVFFASGTSKKLIPGGAPYYIAEVGREEAKSFGYGLVGLKGYLFKLLAQDAAAGESSLFEKIGKDPGCILPLLDKHRRPCEPPWDQTTLFPAEEPQKEPVKKAEAGSGKRPELYIPETEYAANYSPHVKYFIPEWDDRVDPDYDFLTDRATEGRDPYSHDVYAHEIYAEPNYDGVLISKIIVEKNKTKKARIEEMGVHKFIRFDNDRPIMG